MKLCIPNAEGRDAATTAGRATADVLSDITSCAAGGCGTLGSARGGTKSCPAGGSGTLGSARGGFGSGGNGNGGDTDGVITVAVLVVLHKNFIKTYIIEVIHNMEAQLLLKLTQILVYVPNLCKYVSLIKNSKWWHWNGWSPLQLCCATVQPVISLSHTYAWSPLEVMSFVSCRSRKLLPLQRIDVYKNVRLELHVSTQYGHKAKICRPAGKKGHITAMVVERLPTMSVISKKCK